MRICPTCSFQLSDYNYYFCPKCFCELSQNVIKNPPIHLINVKLDLILLPQERFLFFNVPYENRFSIKIIRFILTFVLVASLVLFIFYNLRYGF